ncbi:nitrilase-related carbon-nitrogen hydrolase, partial [Streptomyces californicus]
VGVYICYDRHFPEGWRQLGLGGAQLVYNPSARRKNEAIPWPYGLLCCQGCGCDGVLGPSRPNGCSELSGDGVSIPSGARGVGARVGFAVSRSALSPFL